MVAFGGIATTAKPWSLFTLPLTIIPGASNRPDAAHLKAKPNDLTYGERDSPKV